MTGTYIGINQRVPFDVLDVGISRYFMTGIINKDEILAHVKEFTKGENRALKASKYAVQIIDRQSKVLDRLKKLLGAEGYQMLSADDRKALVLCLVALTYPITYNLLVALAAGFKVQNQISKTFINQKVAAIYGSNRTMDVALDALLPMIIELGTIKRDKISLYSLATKTTISHSFIKELIVYTDIKLSGSKSMLVDDVPYRPWNMYFDFQLSKDQKFHLLSFSEGIVGGGYIKI